MGQEPRNTSIAVIERMYPKKAMVRSRNGNDGSRYRQPLIVVHGLEPIEDTRQIRSRRRQMRPYLHFTVTKFTRHNPRACFQLKNASFRIRGIVVRQSRINVARVSIVPLDEIRLMTG